jgi:hypothetical protein
MCLACIYNALHAGCVGKVVAVTGGALLSVLRSPTCMYATVSSLSACMQVRVSRMIVVHCCARAWHVLTVAYAHDQPLIYTTLIY